MIKIYTKFLFLIKKLVLFFWSKKFIMIRVCLKYKNLIFFMSFYNYFLINLL